MDKFDKPLYGLIAGIILPFIGYAIGKQVIGRSLSWGEYWSYFQSGGDYMNQIFTISMLPTLFMFYFIFFQWKMEYASKGYVAISLVYTAVFMIIKYL